MSPLRHFLAAVVALVLVTVTGVLGYAWIEGWSRRDSIYMTVITLTTVGFDEVQPLSVAGQWITIAFVVFGFASAGFAVAGITAFVVQGELRSLPKGRRVNRQITNLHEHIIARANEKGTASKLGVLPELSGAA